MRTPMPGDHRQDIRSGAKTTCDVPGCENISRKSSPPLHSKGYCSGSWSGLKVGLALLNLKLFTSRIPVFRDKVFPGKTCIWPADRKWLRQ